MQVYKYELSRRKEKLTGSKQVAGEGGGDNGKPQSDFPANGWVHTHS